MSVLCLSERFKRHNFVIVTRDRFPEVCKLPTTRDAGEGRERLLFLVYYEPAFCGFGGCVFSFTQVRFGICACLDVCDCGHLCLRIGRRDPNRGRAGIYGDHPHAPMPTRRPTTTHTDAHAQPGKLVLQSVLLVAPVLIAVVWVV